MTTALLLLVWLSSYTAAPTTPALTETTEDCPLVYDQLLALNKYWKYQPVDAAILREHICFDQHTDLIQLHLQLVEAHLRRQPTDHLSVTQRAKRTEGLDWLHAYWQAGQFPINNHHPGQVVPYFIDDFGTACAVGHMVRETGFGTFAEKVRQENNYAYLEDMDYPELSDWAITYGFEELELRWIQPGYSSPQVYFEATYVLPDCGQNNGSILMDVNLDLGFFNIDSLDVAIFKWYTGNSPQGYPIAFSESLHNVPAGEYTLLVEDATGVGNGILPAYKTFRLGNADRPQLFVSLGQETCEGAADGSINLSVSGGASPYSLAFYQLLTPGFSLFDGEDYNPAETYLGDATNHAGLTGWPYANPDNPNYRAVATDADGCMTFMEIALPTNTLWISSDVTTPDCNLNNGSIAINTSPDEQLTYQWENGSTTVPRNSIGAGHYSITATDNLGCQTSADIYIPHTDGPTLSFTNVNVQEPSCTGASDAAIEINFVDGTPPYQIAYYRAIDPTDYPYEWELLGNPSTASSSYTITGLEGDLLFIGDFLGPTGAIYRLIVEDGEGCQSEHQRQIFDPSPEQRYETNVSGATQCNPPNGSIELSDFICRNENCLSFSWDDGGVGSSRNELLPGDYQVTIYDNCQQDTVNVQYFTVWGGPSVGTVETTPTGCGLNNGTATVESFNNDNTFSWSHAPGLNSNVATGLDDGSYQVSVTPANGCTRVLDFEIVNLPSVRINRLSSMVTSPDQGESNGAISVTASTGRGPINYTWAHDPNLNAPEATGLTEGHYALTATSEGGCTDTITFQLNASSVICDLSPSFEITPLPNQYGYDPINDLFTSGRKYFHLENTSLPPYDSVLWYLPGQVVSGPVATAVFDAEYLPYEEEICMWLYDSNTSCDTTICQTVEVPCTNYSVFSVEEDEDEVTVLFGCDCSASTIHIDYGNGHTETVPFLFDQTEAVYTYPEDGFYQVCITVESDNGPLGDCTEVLCDSISITNANMACNVLPEDVLCLGWVQTYMANNYSCAPGVCGNINLYTNPDGDCVIDFEGEQDCFLTACASHEVFDLSGNLLASYGSECGLEDVGYADRVSIWSCFQEAPDCPVVAPWPVQPCASGNTHFVQVIYSELESDIGGTPLETGDWLGLFYQKDDGSLVCLDQAPFTDPNQENGFQLTACAESSPGADDGFAPDEPFLFRVLKGGVEYDAGQLSVAFFGLGELIPPIFPEATSRFEGGALSSVIRSIRDFPTIEDPSCDTPIPIACGQSLSGTNTDGTDVALSYNCFTNVVDGPEVVYTFTLDQEQDVLITLDGLSDDLELLLLDACDRDHCIAKSERTGSSPEVIHYDDLSAGEYFIIVDGYIGYESSYNLSLDCGDFPPGGFDCQAEDITCGQTVSGSTASGCNEVNYYSCSEAYTPGRERVYRVRFDDPVNVRITLTTEDTDLDLFLLDALDPERCLYFSNESGLETERILIDDNDIIPNRDYFIVVDEYYTDDEGNFELSVECAPDGPPCPWCPPLNICDDVQEIACNTTVTDHTQAGQSRVEKWGDCASYNVGPELIYHFYNPDLQDIQFVLGDFTANLNFYILRGDCSVNACEPDWQGNKSGLIEESILITAMPEGDYYLVVDSYEASSSFSLEVKCDDGTINDCLELPVPQGFSYISSNVTPNDPDITKILNPTDYTGVDIVLSDDQGRNYNPHFSSPNDPNAIKFWEVQNGYRIDASAPIEITICGENADTFQIKEVTSVGASGGVFNNYIGYPFQREMSVVKAFGPSPTENLLSVSYWPPNASSPALNYNLAFDLGNNFTMVPGNGYILKATADGDFTFRNNENTFIPNGCTYFRTPLRNTLQRAFVMAPAEVLAPFFAPGDEIACFTPDGLICGSGKYEGHNLVITVQGDNPDTEEQEGFVASQPMLFKGWSAASGQVQTVAVSFRQHSINYEHNYLYYLNNLQLTNGQFNAATPWTWRVYPNPTPHQLNIEYELTAASEVHLRLMTVEGQLLYQTQAWHRAGIQHQQLDLSYLPAGIYLLHGTTGQHTITQKIIKP